MFIRETTALTNDTSPCGFGYDFDNLVNYLYGVYLTTNPKDQGRNTSDEFVWKITKIMQVKNYDSFTSKGLSLGFG